MKSLALTFYGVGSMDPDPHWQMAPHSHPHHELIVIMGGRMKLKIPGQELIARRGDILHYAPGLVHEERSDPQAPVKSCFVGFQAGGAPVDFPLRVHDAGGRVRRLIRWIEEDSQAHWPLEPRTALLEMIFHEMRRLCGTPPDPWLETVLAFLRQNFASPLMLDDLARCGKMSRFAFVRKFKRRRGRTPMEELRTMRLDRARTLLLTTNLPVKAIASEVGIGDEYQLSKLFRARFDLSPRGMRIRNRPSRAVKPEPAEISMMSPNTSKQRRKT